MASFPDLVRIYCQVGAVAYSCVWQKSLCFDPESDAKKAQSSIAIKFFALSWDTKTQIGWSWLSQLISKENLAQIEQPCSD